MHAHADIPTTSSCALAGEFSAVYIADHGTGWYYNNHYTYSCCRIILTVIVVDGDSDRIPINCCPSTSCRACAEFCIQYVYRENGNSKLFLFFCHGIIEYIDWYIHCAQLTCGPLKSDSGVDCEASV